MQNGTYTLKFVYGDLTGYDMSDANTVKNILKYNGYDYLTVKAPGEDEVIDERQLEIINAEKGVSQIFLTIDCSMSMYTTVNVDGEEKTRLEVEVDAAKKLVDSLIDSGHNIYIGLVFFSGENYRAASLTRNKNLLKEALDDLVRNSNYDWRYNTNIVGALDKASESFYNSDKDNSNRYIILLSDGIPTSNDEVKVYNDEDESETYNKLFNIIIPSTTHKAEDIKNDGIHLISLFTKSDNELEEDLIKQMFEANSELFLYVQDGWETIQAITQSIKVEILSTTVESGYKSSTVMGGYEDSNRRNTVEDYFKSTGFYYGNTMLFDQIDNYNPSDENSKNKALELSNNTWMEVHGGENYVISHRTAPEEVHITHIDPETGKEVIDKIIYNIETKYTGRDLYIARRPLSSLATTTKLTGLKIILANNQTLVTQARDINDLLNGLEFVPLIEYIDNELIEGTKIQLEFTICIQNNSNLQCNHLELINYLPEGFHFINDLHITTPDKTHPRRSDYNWNVAFLPELKESMQISEETANRYENRTSYKLILDNNGQGSDGFYIPPGGKYFVKMCCSLMISSFDSLGPIDEYNDVTEVLRYQNSGNCRMVRTETASTAEGVFLDFFRSIFPGDSKDLDFSDDKNSLFILPPTGRAKNMTLVFMMGIIILLTIFALFIFFIQKHGKKNRK